MTEKELQRMKDFLTYFQVNWEGDIIYLTSGGNSCIMNPETEWQEFLGCSVNSVADAVAMELGKTTKWMKEDY